MRAMEKVIIVGAGPAGISCAYELTKRGILPEVYEASGDIGGIARTMDLWGQRVDLGPHRFFTKNCRVNSFFNEVVQKDHTVVDRLTRIHYRKRFFNYPLKPLNAIRNLGPLTVMVVLFDYLRERLRPRGVKASTFEEWVTKRFGKKLFSIFFKNYTEKLWGIPCSKIDADWAAQRIKDLSLWEAVKSAFSRGGKNGHRTLADQFSYPMGGSGVLYEKAAALLRKRGAKIHLQSPVKRVVLDSNNKVRGVELMSGELVEADTVVSTMPITKMVSQLSVLPERVKAACARLYFRNTILVYLEVDSDDLFEDNWIYVHNPEVKHGRITNFRNWCPSLVRGKRSTILCLEYWAFDGDDLWRKENASLCALAEKEVYQLGLVPGGVKVLRSKVFRVPKCYPVYETGYKQHLKTVEAYLDTISNLIPIGRYGSFKYNNQDHSILMGLLAADRIAGNASMDLWSINTDAEYQEEGQLETVS